jgi:oligopeptide transport system substrate-binding protein
MEESVKSHGYELVEEIGAGGFGVVYRAHQESVGRDVAIKVVLPEIARDPLFVQRFEQEARLAAQLEHPNIVPLYDYWQDDKRAYLVMRWLRGGSLKDALSAGPYGLTAAVRLVDQVAGALETAHQNGVVHRDLKPSNILLDEAGNGYLSDFGIAKHLLGTTVGTPTGAIIGSPAYMSPEQITAGEVTPRSDLYSLAIVIYEILTAETPFGDIEPAAMLYRQVHEPIPLVTQHDPSLPAEIDTVLQRATAKNPTKRYATVSELFIAVEDALVPGNLRPKPGISGQTSDQRPAPTLPHFLQGEQTEPRRSTFVAREQQLGQLEKQLEHALEGRGRVAMVTGEAGSGKSALMGAFTNIAQQNHPDLLVAWGNCDAFSGAGDPYLPFRDVMGMLTGDVESSLRMGTVTQQQALNLWEAMPLTINLLVDSGSDLLNLLVSASSMLTRAESTGQMDTNQLKQLQWISNRDMPGPGDREQEHLFESVTGVLRALAAERPLLLVLDDLQWADQASISLLFHLGRRLTDSRILILGGYRSSEVTLGQNGQKNSLARVLNEFKRIFGDTTIDLDNTDPAEDRALVDALIDFEPNRLGSDVHDALYKHTGGQALFTVELLRELKDRGDLVQDDDGFWHLARTLDWDVLPARVEGVIEEQVSRLEPEVRELLSVASVSGDDFSAQMVASVQNMSERQAVRLLSHQVGGGHGLVDALGEQRLGRQQLWCFRFKHSLFQHFLYDQINPFERRMIHGDVAEALEKLYADQTGKITVQLARHYYESGNDEKAVGYLLLAGDEARAKYANSEAADFYEKALTILKDQKEYEQAARTLMKLGLTYHTAFDYQAARQAYDEGFALWSRGSESDLVTSPTPAIHPLRVVGYEPATLNPVVAADMTSSNMIDQLFDGLVGRTGEMDIVPSVADSWELLEDGRRYVFHLRDDVFWSDGSSVTAQDFEYALKRMLDPLYQFQSATKLFDILGARAYYEGRLNDVDQVGVMAVDLQTLVIDLEKPAGHFLHVIHEVKPVPKGVIDEFDSSWTDPAIPVNNGPYLLNSWEHGESMILERNPRYFGPFQGNIERIEVRFDLDWNEILELYESGDLDVIPVSGPSLRESERARQRHANEYISVPWLQTTFIRFDTRRPPFDDLRVRRAFVMAVDRDKLADVQMGGYWYPGTGGFIAPGIAGHSPGIGLPYEPEAARSLLAEAGYPGGRGLPELELAGAGTGQFSWTREFLKLQWRESLGVITEWKAVDWTTVRDEEWRWPHIYQGGWVTEIPDPDYALALSPTHFDVLQFDSRYDDLVEEARGVMDQERRLSIYQQADRIQIEDAIMAPLLYGRTHILVKPWICGYAVYPSGIVHWKDVVIEPH